MIKTLLSSTVTALTITGINIAFTQPSSAQSDDFIGFYCGIRENTPITLYHGPVGVRGTTREFPIILWEKNGFSSSYQPQTRCEQVSNRFQSLYQSGELLASRISHGEKNGFPIICVIDEQRNCKLNLNFIILSGVIAPVRYMIM